MDFDDFSLPYILDIAEYDKIQNAALKQHIDQVSVEIYQK